jgi:hypothetical protein
MSDSFLHVIPSTPTILPDSDAARKAEALLRTFLPDAERISDRMEDAVTFVDAGSNLERVLCSACGHDLLADGTWQRLMSAAWEARFSRLEVVVPCCGCSTSLNDLRYDWPCGFATYVLEARNPGRTLAPHETEELSSALGCNVRVIHSHV